MMHYQGERVWIWTGQCHQPYRGIITERTRFGCYVYTGEPRDEHHTIFALYTDKELLYDTMLQTALDIETFAKQFTDSA